jgi:hypothetical protein
MNIRFYFLLLIFYGGTAFCQPIKRADLPGGNKQYDGTLEFYIKHTSFPKDLIKKYTRLVLGMGVYGREDSAFAANLLVTLREAPANLFHKLMQTRLEWEFEKHLVFTSLEEARPLIKNNIDSAFYNYTMALYYRDSLTQLIAWKLGFVKRNKYGIEVVDWLKMKHFKRDEMLTWINDHPSSMKEDRPKLFSQAEALRVIAAAFQIKAAELDPQDQFYLKDLLYYSTQTANEKEQQKIKALIR